MCLTINENDVKQIATKDIVCFKWVIYRPDFTPYKGKSFTGIIRGIQCEGKIQVEDGVTFFCTNDSKLNGNRGNDILGYKYAWRFDSNVQSIIIDGVDIMIPIKDSILTTPYLYAEVKLGETYTSELIREYSVINIGLHSFTNYKNVRIHRTGIIVKCIIPKGAEYYEGWFDGVRSYASNKLKYLEIVTE